MAEVDYLSIWAMEHDAKSPFDRERNLGGNARMFMGNAPWGPLCPPEKVFRGISGRNVSKFVLDGRRMLRERYQGNYASGEHDRNSLFALCLPSMAQFRKIYCVKGRRVLRENQHATYFEDSVGLVADWRKAGHVWEIPYGALIPDKVDGLLAAGRCAAAEGDAWEVTRVIPAAALTGQAAGLAAALSLDKGVPPSMLDVKALQAELRKLGFPLHLGDLG